MLNVSFYEYLYIHFLLWRISESPMFISFNRDKLLLLLFSSSFSFVEDIGVEPMTSCVQGRRSSQLS